jgi:hypothetical protein
VQVLTARRDGAGSESKINCEQCLADKQNGRNKKVVAVLSFQTAEIVHMTS